MRIITRNGTKTVKVKVKDVEARVSFSESERISVDLGKEATITLTEKEFKVLVGTLLRVAIGTTVNGEIKIV
jgi:hypothetical protein